MSRKDISIVWHPVFIDLMEPLSHQLAIILGIRRAWKPNVGLKHGNIRVPRGTFFSDEGVGKVDGVRSLLFPKKPGLVLVVAMNIRMGLTEDMLVRI
jgi:hypothetical protein